MPFWLILLLILYLLLPYDLLPDFLLGWGWIDDIAIIGLLGYFFFIRHRKAEKLRDDEHSARGEGFFEKEQGIGSEETKPLNPYEILGLKETASSEEIKAAYRQLANKYHPDKVAHLGEEFRVLAEQKFREIQRAYQTLTFK
jgi:hypothetical protein